MKEDKKFEEYLIEDLCKGGSDISTELARNTARAVWISVMFKYLGLKDKSPDGFKIIGKFIKDRKPFDYNKYLKDGKIKSDLVNIGEEQLSVGIWMNLGGVPPDRATKFFESTIRCCMLPIKVLTNDEAGFSYLDIASCKLWLGYALIMLGRYEEAYIHLYQVVPYFRQYKKNGPDQKQLIFEEAKYFLPMALIPLCEYKLEPTGINLEKARKSVEGYIDVKCDYYSKIHALLYYYHLKDAFPEVYGPGAKANIDGSAPLKLSEVRKRLITLKLPPAEFDNMGEVVLSGGRASVGCCAPLGTNNEFEQLIAKVQSMGDYPTLIGLLDIYMVNCEQDPEPVIEECHRLLADTRIDKKLKCDIMMILQVADAVKNDASMLRFEFFVD